MLYLITYESLIQAGTRTSDGSYARTCCDTRTHSFHADGCPARKLRAQLAGGGPR